MKTRTQLGSAALALALGFIIAACGGDSKTAQPKTIDGPTKTYESHGTVTKIDAVNARVELDHDQIGDWMEPMTMPFPVSDPSLLNGLEVGKRYAFTVVVGGANSTDYMITKLAPAQ